MTEQNKKEIHLLLEQFVSQFPSQAKAVNNLRNVSEATVIAMRKTPDYWKSISDDMWRNVGKQIGWNNAGTGWQLVETQDFTTLITYFADAKEYSNVFGLVGPAGSGKSSTAAFFARNRANTYHITCAEFWNRKMFLSSLLEKMGIENTGFNIGEMMDTIVSTLLKQDTPLIILDEADKLSDQVLYFFITLYNMLHGKCAIVLMATDFLMKRIERGYKLNKKGYAEIFSRLGRKFIRLNGASKAEIKEICQANGIESPTDTIEIINDFNDPRDIDLRRVERLVHKIRVRNKLKNAA